MDTLVISIFEGGYQPMTGLSATTALRAAGFDAQFHDVYVEGSDLNRCKAADTIAIAMPLFD